MVLPRFPPACAPSRSGDPPGRLPMPRHRPMPRLARGRSAGRCSCRSRSRAPGRSLRGSQCAPGSRRAARFIALRCLASSLHAKRAEGVQDGKRREAALASDLAVDVLPVAGRAFVAPDPRPPSYVASRYATSLSVSVRPSPASARPISSNCPTLVGQLPHFVAHGLHRGFSQGAVISRAFHHGFRV